MFWFAGMESTSTRRSLRNSPKSSPSSNDTYEWYVKTKRYGAPEVMTLQETVTADDRQLFDRSTDWPTDHRRSNVTASERVVLEGSTTPSMVKAVFMVSRRPGLTVQEFQERWRGEHGRLTQKSRTAALRTESRRPGGVRSRDPAHDPRWIFRTVVR